MFIKPLSAFCLALSIAGCAGPQPEHFIPGPPLAIPKPPTTEQQAGLAGATGINGAFAQTFTVGAAGFLTEIDLGTQRQSSNSDAPAPLPLSFELRSLQDGLPDMQQAALKLGGVLPISSLPGAGSMEGGMVRVDVSHQHIHVDKGERLAIVEAPSDKSWLQVQIVFGHPYQGGDFYRYEEEHWQLDSNQSQFRIYADTTMNQPVTTAATTTTTVPVEITLIPPVRTLHGTLIAQCVPLPRHTVRSMPVLGTKGSWQFRSHIFTDGGNYYLELTAFNGTNRRGFMFAQGGGPLTITLSRVGAAAGQVIFPLKQNGYVDGRFAQQQMAEPGEGVVRQYKLNDASTPLVNGTYVISVVYPEQISDHAITTTFNVP